MLKKILLFAMSLLLLPMVLAQDIPDEIENFDGDWVDVIEELDTAGFLNKNKGNLFLEGYDIDFDDEVDDTFFLDFGNHARLSNIVISATLELEPTNDEFSVCGLTARDTGQEFLLLAIDSHADIRLVNVVEDNDDTTTKLEPHGDEVEDRQHILAILLEDEITIYVNGELFFEKEDVSLREGTLGLLRTVGTGCTAKDIWVWEIEDSDTSRIRSLPLGNNSNPPPLADFPEILDSYAGERSEIIAELEDADAIPLGSELFLTEDEQNLPLFFETGTIFSLFGINSELTNIIMAAEITLNSQSNEIEYCAIGARQEISSNPSETIIGQHVDVGIANTDLAFYSYNDGNSDDTFVVVDRNLDSDETHQILFIAQENQLTIYIDGQLVAENEEIFVGSGFFTASVLINDTETSCDISNIWVQALSVEEGIESNDEGDEERAVCLVTATNTVNKRSGPGTNYDRDGTLSADEQLEIESQTEAEDGFIWYELEDGSYVREDIINLVGDCDDIPEN